MVCRARTVVRPDGQASWRMALCPGWSRAFDQTDGGPRLAAPEAGSEPQWQVGLSPEERSPSSRPVGLNQGRFCPQGHCAMFGASVVVMMGDGVWHQVGGRPGRLPHRG